MPKFILDNPGEVDLWNLIPRLDQSEITAVSETTATLEFTGGDPNDNFGHAFRVEIFGTGFDNEGDQVTAGTITRLEFYDASDNLVATVTGIKFDAAIVGMFFANGDTGGLQKYLHSGNDKIFGHAENDDISSGAGNDKVVARGGNDFIKDGGGKDNYNGGGGFDTLSYDEWFWDAPYQSTKGIVANLAKGKIKGPDGITDKVKGIEGIRGTFLKDKLLGDKKDNEFSGMNGKDIIDGKGGNDRVRYDNDENQGGHLGVEVDLAAGFAIDGFGQRDKLKRIEDVEGTDNDDTISGNGKSNWLFGRDGEDTIDGGGGGDSVIGGNDADTLTGGAGPDRFEYWAVSHSQDGAEDQITDFDETEDAIAFHEELDQQFVFIETDAFGSNAGEIRYSNDGTDTLVEIDVDGDGDSDGPEDMQIVLLDFTGVLTEDNFHNLMEIEI